MNCGCSSLAAAQRFPAILNRCDRSLRATVSHDWLSRAEKQYVGQWLTQEFCSGGGSTNSVEDRENGDLGGGSLLVRGSGGSCNLVQEIAFHVVKVS